MRSKHLILIYLMLLTSSSIFAVAENEDTEVTSVLTGFAQAMSERSLEVALDQWAEEGEIITLAGGIYQGKNELKAFFQESFNSPYHLNARYEFLPHKIRYNSSTSAFVDGIWKTYNAGPPGYPSCGLFLFQIIKEHGSWKAKLAYTSVPRQGHTAEHGRSISWVKECKKKQELENEAVGY